jgi:O-antigen/teichoic acid export membrane protein
MLKLLITVLKNNAIAALCSYAFSIYLANKIGIEDFGKYSLILVWSNFLSLVLLFSSDSFASKHYIKTFNLQSTLNDILSFRIINFVIVISLFYIYATLQTAPLLIVLFTVFTIFNLSFMFEVSDKVKAYSYIYLIERLTYISFAFSLYYFEIIISIFELLFLYFIVTLISVSAQFYYFRTLISDFRFSTKLWIPIIKDNAYIFIVGFILFSYGGFSRMILEGTHDSSALGIYSAAWQFIVVGTLFQASVDRVWRREMTISINNISSGNFIVLIKKYFLYTTIPMIFLALGFALFSESLVGILYSDEYAQVADLLPYIGIYFVVINLNGFVTTCWIAVEGKRVYLFVNLVFGLSCLIFIFYFANHLMLKDFLLSVISFHLLAVVTLLVFLWNFLQPKKHYES